MVIPLKLTLTKTNLKENMPKLYMYYEENQSGGGIQAGEEEESWPCYNPVYYTFTMHGISLNNNLSYYKEEIDVDWDVKDGEKVFVLIARYSSGGTFGSTHGHFSVQGIFQTEQEMLAKQAILEKDTNDYLDKGNKRKIPYYPWIGYFEHLEDFEQYETEVGRNDACCAGTSNSKRFRI